MENSFIIQFIALIGGLAFFLFGISTANQSLEKLLAKKISIILNKLSQSQFLAILIGVLLTAILQSSGAVTSMLVNLGSARVITLRQVMGVIIGTAVGSTLTVQLMSFNLNQYGLPAFAFFYLIYFTIKNPTLKNITQIFVGFGLMFFGLQMMGGASRFFTSQPEIQPLFASLKSYPMLSVALSTLICGFLHSSAATIGLAMSLTDANAISELDALYWVFGANIGTTSTAIMAAMNSNHVGKQVAWSHFFYKVISVLLFYPFARSFEALILFFNTSPVRAIANFHLYFNIFSAVIFFPFINFGASFMEKIFKKNQAEEFSVEFLKLNNYKSSTMAITFAQREIMRAADIVLSMIKDSLKLFSDFNGQLVESIKDRDNKVDFLYREIKMFLLEHANSSTQAVNQEIMDLIIYISDLERAADSIDHNIIGLASKKSALKLEFSTTGWEEMKLMHENVVKVSTMAVSAFQAKELCEEAINLKRHLAKIELEMRESHIGRLNKGIRESINTSSIHLDVLSEYRRVGSLMVAHAYKHAPNQKRVSSSSSIGE